MLVSPLDFESTQSFTLTLTASDGTESNTALIQINVLDEHGPVFSSPSFSLSMSEYTASFDTFGSFSATDSQRIGNRAELAVTLELETNLYFGLEFSGSMASLVLLQQLDFETANQITLTLTASDGTESTQETTPVETP